MFCPSAIMRFGVLATLLIMTMSSECCDLQSLFVDRRVSVEESAVASSAVFRGLTIAPVTPTIAGQFNQFTAYFHLINTYKGAEFLVLAGADDNRQVNITFDNASGTECSLTDDVPIDYIVFCEVRDNRLNAISIAKWSEDVEQRVWKALGWSGWSDWSACSVSCAGGIQQRTRRCLSSACPEYNVEQRHCNLFGCYGAVNPLAVEDADLFHPSKARWRRVPGRPGAWRLAPNSYIWVPAAQLFPTLRRFPREFTLFVTLRLLDEDFGMGTVFSLRSRRRQDAYLSLELAGKSGMKLVHAASNGTEVVRIPVRLHDKRWHQVTISVHEDSTVETYVDCEWLRTDILRRDALDTPEDSDLIIGYLYTGDIEQMTVVPDTTVVSLQCARTNTPIIDSNLVMEDSIAAAEPTARIRKRDRRPGA